MNIEQIDDIRVGTWSTACSTWLTSFFMATACGLHRLPISHSQINSSPSNGLVHTLLYSWYLILLNSMKTCTFSAVFTTFDTVNLNVNVHYVLRNILLRYFDSDKYAKFYSPKFNVFMQWICQCFLPPKFLSIWSYEFQFVYSYAGFRSGNNNHYLLMVLKTFNASAKF